MMLTDLATVIRAAGLTVHEEPGWRTRGHGQMIATDGIMCHHTAGSAFGNYPSLRVVRDGRTGLPGPLSHLGLARDGSVLVIAAGLCYHAGAPDSPRAGLTGNSDMIGIEAESTGVRNADGTYNWTTAQLRAYPRLVRALARHYGIPASRVLGHREWAPSRKVDPTGIDMAEIRAFVAAPSVADAPSTAATLNTGDDNDMTPAQDAALAAIYAYLIDGGRGRQADDRVLGALPNRAYPDGKPAPVLDGLDGGYLVEHLQRLHDRLDVLEAATTPKP